MERFNIFNRYGEKTQALVERGEAHRKGICHRVVHLWILNQTNQVLVQQRSAQKEAGANLWYVSVGGHMDHREGIEQTLIRETREELGLDISGRMADVQYLYSFHEAMGKLPSAILENEFFDVFVLKADFAIRDMTLQAEEVQAVQYMDYACFQAAILRRDPTFWLHDMGYALLIPALEYHLFGHVMLP